MRTGSVQNMRHGLNQQDLRAVSTAGREEIDSGKRCESVLERRGSRRSAVYTVMHKKVMVLPTFEMNSLC